MGFAHKNGAEVIVSVLHPALGALGITSPVLLAPMAGITDLPFRRAVLRFGAGLVTSEMVASAEMVLDKSSARSRAEFDADCGSSVQLAGRDPHWMGEAARMLRDRGVRMIDINMGCPAKKVTGGQSGSALMRSPDLAVRMIEATAAAGVPVSVKMRLGWCADTLSAPSLARRAEGAGAVMVTVHGRTRMQFYKGRADWDAVRATVDAVSIPVVVNGDVIDETTAKDALKRSHASAVMVGRGAQGAPWRPAEIASALDPGTGFTRPCPARVADLVIAHYDDALSFYGVELGARVMRKHLGWYLAEAGADCRTRGEILREDQPNAVRRLLRNAFSAAPDRCAA